jgi:CheY-like chemotaxis protein
VQQHQQILRANGETESRLSELHSWRQSPAFTEREKAALSLSETVSLHESEERSTQVLKDAQRHFSIEEIVRLTLTAMAVNDWIDLHEKAMVRVLVIEDAPSDQELLLHQLRRTAMEDHVVCVSDAFQALDLIEEYGRSSETGLIAIFLDLHLPGMSGVELLRRLRAMPDMANFPVIVMTSSNDPRDIEECKKLKVMSYVQKPVTFDAFSKAVADIFHQASATTA